MDIESSVRDIFPWAHCRPVPRYIRSTGRTGTVRTVPVSTNLKSAKSPADNGRNKFRPLATGGGYVSRAVAAVNTNIRPRDAIISVCGYPRTHTRAYICAYIVYGHKKRDFIPRNRDKFGIYDSAMKICFQIIPRPGFIRVLERERGWRRWRPFPDSGKENSLPGRMNSRRFSLIRSFFARMPPPALSTSHFYSRLASNGAYVAHGTQTGGQNKKGSTLSRARRS